VDIESRVQRFLVEDADLTHTQSSSGSAKLADELNTAFERVLQAQEGGQERLNAEEALRRALWDNKAGIIAGLRGIAYTAKEPFAEVHSALANLVAKLNEVHRDPRFRSVWTVNQIHVGPYSGPTYTEELDAAEAALAAYSVSSTEGK
jgi:hypothetical protein